MPDGLIHDWIGAICVPGARIEKTLALVQDYDNHKSIYWPEVIGSRLIGRQENDFQIYLRLRKKKIITVILDTEHDVRCFPVDSKRWACRSHLTRICEVEDAGKPTERALPPDSGYGFLWRLTSCWRFEERQLYVDRVPGHLPDTRHPEGPGVDHSADGSQAAQGILESHAGSNALRSYRS